MDQMTPHIGSLPSLCKGGCRAKRGGRVVKVCFMLAQQPLRQARSSPATSHCTGEANIAGLFFGKRRRWRKKRRGCRTAFARICALRRRGDAFRRAPALAGARHLPQRGRQGDRIYSLSLISGVRRVMRQLPQGGAYNNEVTPSVCFADTSLKEGGKGRTRSKRPLRRERP